jgi:hypothetical protein
MTLITVPLAAAELGVCAAGAGPVQARPGAGSAEGRAGLADPHPRRGNAWLEAVSRQDQTS